MNEKIVGHKTYWNDDGTHSHEPLTETEANELWEQVEAAEKRRKEMIPDEQTANALQHPVEPLVRLPQHPCYVGDGDYDHEWILQDESFDHEYGTEQVFYWQCALCGKEQEELAAL